MHHRAGEREALLPAAGERPGELTKAPIESEERDDLGDPSALARSFEAVDPGIEIHVLGHGQIFVEPEALRHVSDQLFDAIGSLADVDAGHDRGSLRWRE